MKGNMKTATIEVLEQGEKVLGSKTSGKYFVREYENDQEIGGSFFKTRDEAWKYIRIFEEDNPEKADEILNDVMRYASSSTKLSSQFIKIS